MPYWLRYVYPIRQIAWDVAVHMGRINDLKVEVIPLVVDADMMLFCHLHVLPPPG